MKLFTDWKKKYEHASDSLETSKILLDHIKDACRTARLQRNDARRLARKLKRERDEAREENEALRNYLKEADEIGMNLAAKCRSLRGELAALRGQLDTETDASARTIQELFGRLSAKNAEIDRRRAADEARGRTPGEPGEDEDAGAWEYVGNCRECGKPNKDHYLDDVCPPQGPAPWQGLP